MRNLVPFAIALSAPLVGAQTTHAEVEPNETRAQATPVSCLAPGDLLTGTSQGVSTGVPGPASADTFRIRVCPTSGGIWKHSLTLTTAIDQHRGSIRGRDQGGTPGNGGIPGSSDIELQATPFVGPRANTWYGFGREEEFHWRVSGTSSTTAPYFAAFSSSPVVPMHIGSFSPGTITISSIGQGHTTDTDLWLYDSTGHALPGHGNDDAWPSSGLQSRLARVLTTGTYWLAIARYNLANDQAAAWDDAFPAGALADTPDFVVQGVLATAASTDVSFAVSDTTTSVPVSAILSGGTADQNPIAWYRFDVGLAPQFTRVCAGDGLDPLVGASCPCGNLGAPGRGCANSANAAGAELSASGTTNPDTLVLAASGMPATVATVFLQGDAYTSAVFGDGVRCVGGFNIRLRTIVSSSGAALFPGPSEPSVSLRGNVVPGSGVRRWYQAYYRNASTAFCPPATFNVTNAWVIDW